MTALHAKSSGAGRATNRKNLPAAKKAASASTLLRYREKDTTYGVTRQTAQQLAEHFGVNDTQLLHLLLAQAAARELPQYEADDGPLSDRAWAAIQARAPKKLGKVVESLID